MPFLSLSSLDKIFVVQCLGFTKSGNFSFLKRTTLIETCAVIKLFSLSFIFSQNKLATMLKILGTMLLIGVHGHFTYSTSTWPRLWKCQSLRNFLFELLEWKNEGEREEEKKIAKKNRVNQHPRWYLHLLLVRPLIDHINLKNARFELRDPDLLLAWDIYNIQK